MSENLINGATKLPTETFKYDDKGLQSYTDLDGDGLIDSTYNNRFSYSGYFDPELCYGYGSSSFKAVGTATSAA